MDAPRTTNTEGLLVYQFSYFTQHFPKTGFDVDARLLPGLSQWGRVRLEINTTVRRELFPDFTVSISVYDTFDNRPPSQGALKNDVGVVTSVGWVF